MSERIRRRNAPDVIVPKSKYIPEIRTKLFLGAREESDENQPVPHSILIPGIAQNGLIPPHIATKAKGVDVADAFPYQEVSADRLSMEALSVEYPLAIIRAYQTAYEDETLVPSFIAESQAVVGVTLGEQEYPELINHIALLRGLGVGVEKMGATQKKRLRNFGGRALKTMVQFDQHLASPLWNLYSGYRLNRLAWQMGSKAAGQIDVGLTTDIIPILEKRVPARLDEHKHTALFYGTRDKLMHEEEQKEAQRRVGDALEIYPQDASHRSLATPRGTRDLQEAIDWINSIAPELPTPDSLSIQ